MSAGRSEHTLNIADCVLDKVDSTFLGLYIPTEFFDSFNVLMKLHVIGLLLVNSYTYTCYSSLCVCFDICFSYEDMNLMEVSAFGDSFELFIDWVRMIVQRTYRKEEFGAFGSHQHVFAGSVHLFG